MYRCILQNLDANSDPFRSNPRKTVFACTKPGKTSLFLGNSGVLEQNPAFELLQGLTSALGTI